MSAPVAVIADVHGNSWALDAVLADARARAARTFLDLGDCLDGPLDPAGTADLLLRPEHLDWLTGFPTAAEHEDIVLLHVTPHDVDLDQVGRAAHVTPAHLVRRFHAELGITPMAYLWQRRVAVGLDLLTKHRAPCRRDRGARRVQVGVSLLSPRQGARRRAADAGAARLVAEQQRLSDGRGRPTRVLDYDAVATARKTLRPPAPPRVSAVLEPAGALADDARLVAVRLEDLDLAQTTATASELERSRMSGCELSGARLTRVGLLDVEVERCSLANVLARDCALARASLSDCRLTGLTWAEGTIEDVTFRGCQIDLAAFRFARLHRVVFDECVLREADFQDARLSSVRFDGCDLTGASFTRARVDVTELRRCRLEAITGVEGLRGAALEWADIVGLAGTFAAALGLRVIDEDDLR